MTKTKNRVVTGPSVVIVETTDKVRDNPVAVAVRRGEELPSNLADGQLDKLEAMGAFLSPAEHRASMLAGPQSSRLAEEPVPSGIAATPASLAHSTAPEGEAVTTPGITPLEEENPADRETVDDEAAHVAHNTAEEANEPEADAEPKSRSRRS